MEENLKPSEIEKIIKDYTPELLLQTGKEFANKSKYLEAHVIFNELLKHKNYKELAEMYFHLINMELYFENTSEFLSKMGEMKVNQREAENQIIDKVVENMAMSTFMYSEKEISKKDLLLIEKLVDKIPFKKMSIRGKEEFERIYCSFKEYCLEVFLGNK